MNTHQDILIVGATGTVGSEVQHALEKEGVSPKRATRRVKREEDVYLDLESEESFEKALRGIKKLYLMRPPAITDAKGVFRPFLNKAKEAGVEQVVFLSLVGAEKLSFLPHRKIEKEIERSGISYTFLRPGFFMQNIETVHLPELLEKNELMIPMGRASLNLIDAADIAAVAARVLLEPGHENQGYALTGSAGRSMGEIAQAMADQWQVPIHYKAPSCFSYRKALIDRGEKPGFALVSTLLYAASRLGVGQEVNDTFEKLMGRPPNSLENYLARIAKEVQREGLGA